MIYLFGCQQEAQPADAALSDETQAMINELKAIAEDRSNIDTWHLNRERAMHLDNQLDGMADPGAYMTTLFKAGLEWLNAGEYQTSIERLEGIFEYIKSNNLRIPPNVHHAFSEVLGVAYLRKAEIENCIKHHNEYSCIIPIEKGGQHVEREGGEAALRIFSEMLEGDEPDLQTRWLYNITQMTLGGYPNNISSKLLIDPQVFESEMDFPRFKEIGMNLGVGVNDISGGVVLEDFNNDGYLDILASSYGLDDQLRLFINDGKGGFTDRTDKANLEGIWSGLNMVQADYDNDGWVDVLILRGAWLGTQGNHPNSLLKNNGDGTFSDVTKASGLYCRYPTQTASWADFNNDGWIDLFIGNEFSENVRAPAQLFQNNKDGTFTDVASEKGLALEAFSKGSVFGDYNNDGFPDIYVSCINGQNYLMKNEGPSKNFTFTNVAPASNTADPQLSFPCWFFDYNQDGWEDLFVSGFDFRQFETAAGEVARDYLDLPVSAELPVLYRNNQDGTFTDVSKEANTDHVLFTMGCNFGDLNNDGYPDFYAATGTPDFRALIPNRMFLNGNGKRFFDVTKSGGFGHLQKGHGVAFGDLDNDGDQDIYHVLGGSYDGDNFMNALFENPGMDNHWIKLKLIGTKANRSAIGARIKIVASDANGQTQVFYNRVNSGGSFGANPLLVEQGLGSFANIQSVDIIWPGGRQAQKITGLTSGTYYIVTQGEKETERIKAEPVTFKQGHHHH